MENKLIDILEQIKKEPETKKAFEKNGNAGNVEEAISFLIDRAGKLGYQLTREELEKEIKAEAEQRKDRTEEAVSAVERLSDDEVARASGGTGEHYSDCLESFLDWENCWEADGCDKNFQHYDNYLCENNNLGKQCGTNHSLKCNTLFVLEPRYFGCSSVS